MWNDRTTGGFWISRTIWWMQFCLNPHTKCRLQTGPMTAVHFASTNSARDPMIWTKATTPLTANIGYARSASTTSGKCLTLRWSEIEYIFLNGHTIQYSQNKHAGQLQINWNRPACWLFMQYKTYEPHPGTLDFIVTAPAELTSVEDSLVNKWIEETPAAKTKRPSGGSRGFGWMWRSEVSA